MVQRRTALLRIRVQAFGDVGANFQSIRVVVLDEAIG